MNKISDLKPIEPIRKGDYVVFSQGEYSDYSYIAVCKALCDLNHADIETTLRLSGAVNEEVSRGFKESKWVAYLLRENFFEEISARELYLGGYGSLVIHDCGTTSMLS